MATRFGAYEILHELKHGGMGAVLLGRRRGPGSFEQLVALKTIRPEYASLSSVRAMFLDEAAILARINHPGIAGVHDFGDEAGTLYMAMEYVAGISFRALAELSPPASIAARAIAEACRGVHAAHEVRDTGGNVLGVVHRDLSPDNLMLGFDGHVKVIDFGIALVKNRHAPVTEFGTVKGKPPYMSPEQVKNETMDRRSDVFSLAVVLHELLTNKPLFDGDSIYAVARAVEHLDIPLPSLAARRPMPLGLDAAVMNALDRNLARRTPTAAALAESLEQVIAAAGDETLEAWAERELAAPRAAHRQWIARIVTGREQSKIGRATGAQTQIGPAEAAALAKIMTPPVLPGDRVDPAGSTHLAPPDDDDLSIPPRRSLVLPLVLALVVLLGVGGGVLLLRRHEAAESPDARPPDAAVDAAVDAIIADAAIDAPPIDAVELVRIDPPVRRLRPDARPRATVRVDAAPPPDAAPAVAGVGRISIPIKDNEYVNVTIDGAQAVTPYLDKPIAAGRHHIVFTDPQSGAVLHQTTVDVRPGEKVTVRPP